MTVGEPEPAARGPSRLRHHVGHRAEDEVVRLAAGAAELATEIRPAPTRWLLSHVLLTGSARAVVLAGA